ncbi:ras-related protein Rab-32 [Amphiprion ocellaris]|uniref:Ras-related protein Rab n=1 Tax=Amphiprion ocellaris TaxID=80972 RepID=A0AAQ6ACZ1_AMPOC|nr:ras-related protein Rab-32 [Amphiprion ocellaris]
MERSSVSEKLFKVLVIGDIEVGKTSIVMRYVKKCFDQAYKATIGVDFFMKTVEWDAKTVVRMQLWDLSGQDRIKNLSRVYYKAAMGALVVFDITNSLTLKSATEWKQDLDSKLCLDNGRPVPAVLLANKCDLMKTKGEDLVSSLDRFCKDNNFLGWFETSAKENINIDEAGSFLVKQMMLCDGSLSDEEHQRDGIKSLTQTPMKISGTSCC